MSSDPKKPFDAPPSATPDLLQKDMQLDRRRRAPSFEELKISQPRPPTSEAPTDPARAPVPRPQQAVPPNLTPRAPVPPPDFDPEPLTRPMQPSAQRALAAATRPPAPPAPRAVDEQITEPVPRSAVPQVARPAAPTAPGPGGPPRAAPPPPAARPPAAMQAPRAPTVSAQPPRAMTSPDDATIAGAPRPASPDDATLAATSRAAPRAPVAAPRAASPDDATLAATSRAGAPAGMPRPAGAPQNMNSPDAMSAGVPRSPAARTPAAAPQNLASAPRPADAGVAARTPDSAVAARPPVAAPQGIAGAPRSSDSGVARSPAAPPRTVSSPDALTAGMPRSSDSGVARSPAAAPQNIAAAPRSSDSGVAAPRTMSSPEAPTTGVPRSADSGIAARPPAAAPRSSDSGVARSPAVPQNVAAAPRSSDSGVARAPAADAGTFAGGPGPSDAMTLASRAPASNAPQLGDESGAWSLGPAPKRVAPPSPTEFAQTRPHQAAMPQVTPSAPYQGAIPPEPLRNAGRPAPAPQPARAAPQPQPAVESYDAPADEPRTVQDRSRVAPPAVSTVPPAPSLPREMMVTQPGFPGPFANARVMPQGQSVPQRPPSLDEFPAQSAEQPNLVMPAASEAVLPGVHTVTAEPASLWRRLGAWLTDLLFVAVLVLGLLMVAMQVIAPKHMTLLNQLIAIALPGAALAGILAFVYTALFAFLWNGRTPGRRLMGIHLVDASGHAPAPMRSLIRAMLSLVSFALFLSGFWLALFDRHGQTLHDKLTRTFVVKLQDA